jgi:hypothetical protein
MSEIRLAVTRRPWNRDGKESKEMYDFLLSRELQQLLDAEVQMTLDAKPGVQQRRRHEVAGSLRRLRTTTFRSIADCARRSDSWASLVRRLRP